MDNFISILRDANSPEELENLKLQLFRENVRIKTDKSDLEDMKVQIEKDQAELEQLKIKLDEEKSDFEREVAKTNRKLESDRKKLETDLIFMNKKQMVLESAYKQLDIDRQRLYRDKEDFKRLRESYPSRRSVPELQYRQGIFFKGITDEKSLRKRYKDLIKVFHPDNFTGDKDTLQNINREYETLLHDLKLNE